jgi:hypothetical protein
MDTMMLKTFREIVMDEESEKFGNAEETIILRSDSPIKEINNKCDMTGDFLEDNLTCRNLNASIIQD